MKINCDPANFGHVTQTAGCSIITNDSQFYTVLASVIFCASLYLICFVIGCRNIWFILIKFGYYKATFLSLQYFMGQLICMIKVASLCCWINSAYILRNKKLCYLKDWTHLTILHELEESVTSWRNAMIMGYFVMLTKVCLGILTIAMIS